MALGFPPGRWAPHPLVGRPPRVEAWLGPSSERACGPMAPAARRGGIANSQLPEPATGVRRRKGFAQGGRRRRLQVVQDHTPHGSRRALPVHHRLQPGRDVVRGTPVGDFDVPPLPGGRHQPAQRTRALPALRLGVPGRLPRHHWQGLGRLPDQWGRTLVHPDPRRSGGRRLGVEAEHRFHAPDNCRAHGGNPPCLVLPWREPGFFRGRRTVSAASASTRASATRVSARSGLVQHGRACGGARHARALRTASGCPSPLRRPPGRGRSARAASRPASTQRVRGRSTVAVPIWRACAMTSSGAPAGAWSRRCARFHGRAAPFPRVVRASHRARSSSVNVTIDCLPRAPSWF